MMTPDEAGIELRRRLAATPSQVFAAFAEPRLLTRWLTPSPVVALTLLQFDFREGGAYRFAYGHPQEGTVIVRGSYRSIEPPTRIVFSWAIEPPDQHAGIESEVTVAITPSGGGSELVIRHARLLRTDIVERHRGGWVGALDQLTVLLEKDGPLPGH
jgi:uncharacterized protein YndB with AHSA1/START domain